MQSIVKWNGRPAQRSLWDPLDFMSDAFGWRTEDDFFEYEHGENDLIISADVPGASKEDVSVKIEGNVLTVEAHRKGRWTRNRSIVVSRSYDCESAKATLDSGILKIKIPKLESAKTKMLTIETPQS